MITELDDMYVVFKVNDIHMGLSPAERLALDEIADKIRQFRVSIGRRAYLNYVVVSEVLECYSDVKQMVLDELNDE